MYSLNIVEMVGERSGMLTIALVILLSCPMGSLAQSPCFSYNKTWTNQDGDVLDVMVNVASEYKCQSQCADTSPPCYNWTWTTELHPSLPKMCTLFGNVSSGMIESGSVISGPASCPGCSGNYGCTNTGDNLLEVLVDVGTEAECLASCVSTSSCQFFTWYNNQAEVFVHFCFLFSSCSDHEEGCQGCVSGPVTCSTNTTTTTPVSNATTTRPTTTPSYNTSTLTPNITTPECRGDSQLVTMNPEQTMLICDDPYDNTCEQDIETLCPIGFSLCTPSQFNTRNSGWDFQLPAQPGADFQIRPLGVIQCRTGRGGGAHYTLGATILNLNQDEQLNCWYSSSRPECPATLGCTKPNWAQALCCKNSASCGNGKVDSPEELCDDGNMNNDDSCLNSCTWRIPAEHGYENGLLCNW